MIELLEKTTPDSDSSEIAEANAITLIERYSVKPENIKRSIGEIVMATQTTTYVDTSTSDSDSDHSDY